jgi:reactive intermediate/imine deaminase
MHQIIQTDKAPSAIGSYSQAIKAGNTVYLSGQIPLDPITGDLVKGNITAQVTRVFENIQIVAEAAGGNMDAIVKLTVYLINLADIAVVNEIMASYFTSSFPARTSIQVSALPKGSAVEVEAIMVV